LALQTEIWSNGWECEKDYRTSMSVMGDKSIDYNQEKNKNLERRIRGLEESFFIIFHTAFAKQEQ
jgi:hypothetical protein